MAINLKKQNYSSRMELREEIATTTRENDLVWNENATKERRDKEIKFLFMTIAENIHTLTNVHLRDLNYMDLFDIAKNNYTDLLAIIRLNQTIAELNAELKNTEKNLTIIF